MPWTRLHRTFRPAEGKRISRIIVAIAVDGCGGALRVTDLQLQPGSVPTGWVGHPSELRWTLDSRPLPPNPPPVDNPRIVIRDTRTPIEITTDLELVALTTQARTSVLDNHNPDVGEAYNRVSVLLPIAIAALNPAPVVPCTVINVTATNATTIVAVFDNPIAVSQGYNAKDGLLIFGYVQGVRTTPTIQSATISDCTMTIQCSALPNFDEGTATFGYGSADGGLISGLDGAVLASFTQTFSAV